MILRITLIVLFIVSLFIATEGQNTWTLDDCIAYAIENNPNLYSLKLDASAWKEEFKQSKRNQYLPFIAASTGYDTRGGRSIDPNTNEYINTRFSSNNYSINASMNVFSAFQNRNITKANEFLYEAAIDDVRQEKFMLAFRIMRAYYDVIYLQGREKNAIEQLSISESNVDFVEKQIELGLRAKADLYESQAVVMADQLALSQTQNSLANAKLRLKQEMNYEEIGEIAIDQDDLNSALVVQNVTDSLYQLAKDVVPSIQAQRNRVHAADKQLLRSKGALYPSLTANIGWNTYYSETFKDVEGNVISFGNQWTNNRSQSAGISLNIPILNKWQTRSQISQSKINVARATNELKIQELRLLNITEQLTLDNKTLKTEFEQSVQNVELQALTFEIAEKRYEKGLINILDLRQAKNEYARAQNLKLEVKSKLAVNQKTIEFYKGLNVFGLN